MASDPASATVGTTQPPTRVGRLGLVSRLLAAALPSLTPSGGTVRVLDCGGGSGTYAVPLAAAGADVMVVDVSADALATLRRRAEEAGVSASVRAVPGDVEALGELPEVTADSPFDLVLAHGIFDALDDVAATFSGLAAAVRPGGLLSILVGNPSAAVLGHALSGDTGLALALLCDLDNGDRAGPEALARLCAAHRLVVESRHGIGVFSDLVPGSALETPASRESLAELELEAAGRAPFAEIAARIHLLARRPA